MIALKQLVEKNLSWQKQLIEKDPTIFERSAATHCPEIFCITCSDARVCIEQITQAAVGQIFVHRNVANMINADDLSLVAATTLALEVLGVSKVFICAHYGCQGVGSALSPAPDDLMLKKWLSPIGSLYREHREQIEAITSPERRHDRLVELHLQDQIKRFEELSVVRRYRERQESLEVVGMIYDIRTGCLKPMI